MNKIDNIYRACEHCSKPMKVISPSYFKEIEYKCECGFSLKFNRNFNCKHCEYGKMNLIAEGEDGKGKVHDYFYVCDICGVLKIYDEELDV